MLGSVLGMLDHRGQMLGNKGNVLECAAKMPARTFLDDSISSKSFCLFIFCLFPSLFACVSGLFLPLLGFPVFKQRFH